ncbi:restriction endonuclease subunit S [Gillisia sp. Hel_I_29]|uniref:restriction endonuclease subunit S n=1 Tax=Gillisia sp. Hel_I_29 TaxID=1249975 RepID=UPI000557756D|nr:restriction endonuclease subunit S [Gillisia sp. Hel_I_29]
MVEIENKVQRYETYKDSGVEWLGEIPEHWDLTRLGTRFEQRKTKVSDKDYPALSVTKNGTIPQLASAAKSNDGDNRKLVKKGDFVINSRSDRKGSSGIAYQDGSVSLIYIVMEPLNIHPIYCNYLLKSYNFIEEFYRMGHGIVADLWTTRYDEMKAIMVGIPPLQEQTAIAQFLDDKATKIDEAITIKEQQISLLKERKQILIHKAVTQGLNPNIKLKDSGVEWIGEIPEHWEVKKIKHVTSKIGSGITPSGGGTTYLEEGIPLLRSQNIFFDKIELDGVAFISDKVHQSMSNSKVFKGDVLLNITGGSIGRCYFVNSDIPLNVNQHVCILRPNKKITTLYLNRLIASQVGQNQIWFHQQGGGREGLNFQALKNFIIPFPSLSEQKEISAYIETASRKIETAIRLKQQEIAKLKEYKSSLINSVVTGKIKVC